MNNNHVAKIHVAMKSFGTVASVLTDAVIEKYWKLQLCLNLL